jgi:hypothetical protein
VPAIRAEAVETKRKKELGGVAIMILHICKGQFRKHTLISSIQQYSEQ